MLDQVVSLGWGLLSLSREKAEKFIINMIRKGELNKENGMHLLRALVERGAKERAVFKENTKAMMVKLLEKGIFATKNEFVNLENRVKKIEESLKEPSHQ